MPSCGSIVQARRDVSVYKLASAGELKFAGWLLCIHFGLMINTDSKQLSCVVVLINILTATSLAVILLFHPCPSRHLFKSLLELKVSKGKTKW